MNDTGEIVAYFGGIALLIFACRGCAHESIETAKFNTLKACFESKAAPEKCAELVK